MSLTPDTTCHTYRKEKKFIYKWIIHKYSSWNMKSGNRIESSKFEFYCNTETTISGYLFCYPRGFVAVGYSLNTEIPVKFSVLDSKGNKALELTCHSNTFPRDIISHAELMKNKDSLLPDDDLTILCEMEYVEYESSWTQNKLKFEKIKSKLNIDLASLFESEKHWDVTLLVGAHELHAHKCILASRSDVFAAMFEHEMKEGQSNRVTITDCEPEVFKEMLHYIYTGNAPNLQKMTIKLLAVSDKYGLEHLKYMCEDKLFHVLTIPTVAEILILADLYRSKELKANAILFLNNNAKAVTETAGWQKLLKSDHFHLIAEVYLKLID